MPRTGGRLAGERALVAGVGPGIGSAIVARFAQEGANVVGLARNPSRTAPLTTLGRAHGLPISALACDLLDPAAFATTLQEAEAALDGPPTILVNAVGGWRSGPATHHDPALVSAMLEANLRTIMTTTPPVADQMVRDGNGAILNIAAIFGGAIPGKGQAVYDATKAGVVGYTRSLAAELLEHHVRVNCLMPGGTSHDWDPKGRPPGGRRLGKDRIGTPEDVAAAALFLVSREASWITGVALPVDGGESVRTH